MGESSSRQFTILQILVTTDTVVLDIIVLTYHVISPDNLIKGSRDFTCRTSYHPVMELYGQVSIKVSQYPLRFGGQIWHSGSRDIMVLLCYVLLQSLPSCQIYWPKEFWLQRCIVFNLSRDLTRTFHQKFMLLYGLESLFLVFPHYPAKGHRHIHCISGDVMLLMVKW